MNKAEMNKKMTGRAARLIARLTRDEGWQLSPDTTQARLADRLVGAAVLRYGDGIYTAAPYRRNAMVDQMVYEAMYEAEEAGA